MTTTTSNMRTVTEAWPESLRVTPDDGASVVESIQSALGQSLGRELVLDLRNIRRITSHQLSALIGFTLILRSRQQQFVLIAVD